MGVHDLGFKVRVEGSSILELRVSGFRVAGLREDVGFRASRFRVWGFRV